MCPSSPRGVGNCYIDRREEATDEEAQLPGDTMHDRKHRERGAAAVEFALVLPMVLLLIFGSVEVGLMVQARSSASNAAREAVRFASLGYSTSEVESVARAAVSSVSGTVEVRAECIATTSPTCTLGSNASGNTAKVTVTIRYRGITGILGSLSDAVIVRTAFMRIE